MTGGFEAVAAVSKDDVWAIGGNHDSAHLQLQHWDGKSWTEVFSPLGDSAGSVDLRDIWAISSNEVWAVGHNDTGPLIMHWDGDKWLLVPNAMSGHQPQMKLLRLAAPNIAKTATIICCLLALKAQCVASHKICTHKKSDCQRLV